MTKNILVTGGLGFIGSHLVDRLVEKNFNLIVIDDLSTGLKSNKNDKAVYLYQDITDFIYDTKKINNILNEYNIDTVYHLAASADVSLSISNPEKVFHINSTASIALLNSCIKSEVKKFLFTSTSAVYGEPLYLPVDDKHPTNPISPYGLSKLFTEQFMHYNNIYKNISSIIFRLPNVYGPRQRPDLEGGVIAIFDDLMKKKLPVKIFGDGKQTRDWVHVNDVVEAFILSLEIKDFYKLLLLGSEDENDLNKLFELMANRYQYGKLPNYAKKRTGDILRMVMNHSEAKKTISWSPKINLEEGINNLE